MRGNNQHNTFQNFKNKKNKIKLNIFLNSFQRKTNSNWPKFIYCQLTWKVCFPRLGLPLLFLYLSISLPCLLICNDIGPPSQLRHSYIRNIDMTIMSIIRRSFLRKNPWRLTPYTSTVLIEFDKYKDLHDWHKWYMQSKSCIWLYNF